MGTNGFAYPLPRDIRNFLAQEGILRSFSHCEIENDRGTVSYNKRVVFYTFDGRSLDDRTRTYRRPYRPG